MENSLHFTAKHDNICVVKDIKIHIKERMNSAMLLRTYHKMINEFAAHNGYMSFGELKEAGITILQIREMEEEKVLDKFARGWYWCNDCGLERPENHEYIEIGKANPRAVICMESAAYIQGIIKHQPELICVATDRTDRKKMEFAFPVHRFYLQNADIQGEIEVVHTDFGDYNVYSLERTICDCLRMKDYLSDDVFMDVVEYYNSRENQLTRVKEYAKALRALRNVESIELGN
jgi:predicted transcriptional regulator of viral defense system